MDSRVWLGSSSHQQMYARWPWFALPTYPFVFIGWECAFWAFYSFWSNEACLGGKRLGSSSISNPLFWFLISHWNLINPFTIHSFHGRRLFNFLGCLNLFVYSNKTYWGLRILFYVFLFWPMGSQRRQTVVWQREMLVLKGLGFRLACYPKNSILAWESEAGTRKEGTLHLGRRPSPSNPQKSPESELRTPVLLSESQVRMINSNY